ncbi:hypothetical protein CROQUDRAFT_715272 [Cronartium quercuum f. sp. fusiforme G11]|uniref:Uncharacterized protein n=1 Tax=Cronartium quercuum f. sp. fusiforme G11 TaxID=708437 RepID=A0A9P6NMQ2_9BASI|nr:hypothetical protein CROQUDRAFT_715272 [Cronartium quercuum f. sp. fusiforme G11]
MPIFEYLRKVRATPSDTSFACRGNFSDTYSETLSQNYNAGAGTKAYVDIYGTTPYSTAQRCLVKPVPFYTPPSSGRRYVSPDRSTSSSFAPRDNRRKGVVYQNGVNIPTAFGRTRVSSDVGRSGTGHHQHPSSYGRKAAYPKPEYIAVSRSTLDYNAYEADLSTYAGSSIGRTGYDSSANGTVSRSGYGSTSYSHQRSASHSGMGTSTRSNYGSSRYY